MKQGIGLLTLLVFLFLFANSNDKRKNATPQYLEYKFALSLVNGPNSQIASFAIVSVLDTIIIKSQSLTRDQFLAQITGRQKSIANPDLENLMDKNGIPDCLPEYDSVANQFFGYYCPIIDDLWKVRYKRNPFAANMRQDGGWAHNYYGPSQPQLKFLREKYRVKNIADYFIGEKMFQLLRDMQDTSWQRRYLDVR